MMDPSIHCTINRFERLLERLLLLAKGQITSISFFQFFTNDTHILHIISRCKDLEFMSIGSNIETLSDLCRALCKLGSLRTLHLSHSYSFYPNEYPNEDMEIKDFFYQVGGCC
ncbi:hypothetical protein AMTRI_Chr06g177520 [Amborella trichopoda]